MLEEMASRRSIRKYTDQPVEEEELAQLLEAARLAPSGSNTQPWHFIVVKSGEMRSKLANIANFQNWMATAPVHIVCVADIRSRIDGFVPVSVDEKSPVHELKQVIRDTAIAVEHIVLMAEHLGIGACWVAKFKQDQIRPVLNIPDDKYVVCILTVGYADQKPEARSRKKLEEIVHYESW
ncbi:MAG TPA: nitroreductase family protein [Anaerovoracaceae bacterium]|nr:nitroreductase family protein [Anaerovoracaceae bacterium]